VVERFADDYLAGRTPIPCIRCNMGPKFTDLLAMARDLGADCLATGHYVRRVMGAGGAELHRALDPARDQSYFLMPPPRRSSISCAFRWAACPSPGARTGRSFGLASPPSPIAGHLLRARWRLCQRRAPRPPRRRTRGDIVHAETGAVLGQHKGVIHYTVGQRRGLEIGGQAEPLYVVGIDAPNARCWSANAPCWPWARRITETNRIGPCPRVAAYRQGAIAGKPVPVVLDGPLGDGARR
jgi:tRNA-specific 2-thiouridylase